MAVKRAPSISLKNFSAAVEKASQLLAEKNQLTQGLHISPTIIGKVARPKDFAQAEKLASDLTNSLTHGGGPLAALHAPAEPAVLIRGGVIICGFIAPEVEFRE